MSFKNYILNVHPDPDFLGIKTVYDAYDELDRLAQNYAKDQNERLTKELELCQTGNSDLQMEVDELKETKALRDAYANKIERQNLRIEILKKDVVTLDSELTRLRELLDKSKKYVLEKDFVLASEIDNALNHKP